MNEATSTFIAPNPSALPTGKPTGKGIGLDDSAVVRLKKLLAERNTPNAGLRIAVKGGGCSGLAYHMEWAEEARPRDKTFEREGVRVFIDPKSYLYLMGTELIFEETIMASGFKLRNPNEKSACGCGDSFSV
ncbi:MAG: iron-sulfur cluster assembly accessory protein [Myxococcales bacterium]|nr:iron-sulfur cluster assembly accessory protein [Myxococcales bacterium]MDP3502888.1 iron-sulfur cluster assembly accessory protein [Myxococcales bacterium]